MGRLWWLGKRVLVAVILVYVIVTAVFAFGPGPARVWEHQSVQGPRRAEHGLPQPHSTPVLLPHRAGVPIRLPVPAPDHIAGHATKNTSML